MKKCILIYNPRSGREIFASEMSNVITNLSKKYEVTVIPTTHKGHIAEVIKKNYNRFDIIVVCGGDGSISESVECITKNKINKKFAIIPAGSTNDFSKNIYKTTSIKEISKIIVKDHNTKVDIFEINKKAITYVAGFGLFTDLSYSTPQNLKNILGYGGYVLNAASKLPEISLKRIELNYIDIHGKKKSMQEEVYVCLFSNSKQVAGMEHPLSRFVDLHDGIIECMLIRPLKENETINDVVKVIKMKSCTISINESVKWTIDGEYGGNYKKAVIKYRDSIKIISEQVLNK